MKILEAGGVLVKSWRQLLAAILFYTSIPITAKQPEFRGMARYAPIVGLLIGFILIGADNGFRILGMPSLTRSAVIVFLWISLTGGLHLDGAMDAADGLAVPDRQRRLTVMADSHSGAFGVMAAVAILGLKTLALVDLNSYRTLVILLALGWGRWGQVVAIVRYPYLRSQGKGAIHKIEVHPVVDILTGLVALFSLGMVYWLLHPKDGLVLLGLNVGGIAIATAVGAWFNHQFKGHTGDTYGAVVEWTEALLICLATLIV